MQFSPSSEPAALFLDLDGTLVEIAETPHLVEVTQDLLSTLRHLQRRLHGSLALVTGRPLAQLDALVAPARFPAAGTHGGEIRLVDGTVRRTEIDEAELALRAQALHGFAAHHPGVVVEDKGLSIALHYRQRPDLEADVHGLVQRVAHEVREDFHVLHGKMVAELRPRGVDKGFAVEQLMQSEPFRGRTPIYVGDDVTDEDAFAVVNRMGGRSIVVGTHESLADERLADVQAVHAWLRGVEAEP